MERQCSYQHVLCVMSRRFTKEQETSGLLSQLDIKSPLSKIPLLGDILF